MLIFNILDLFHNFLQQALKTLLYFTINRLNITPILIESYKQLCPHALTKKLTY